MRIESFNIDLTDDIEVTFLNYGGIIQRIRVPDKNGVMDDVVLGFDNNEDYLKEHPYFGALIGRYANRISKGKFKLKDKTYLLTLNNEGNSLHGGARGFDKAFWKVQKLTPHSYLLSHHSPDGDEGYPGSLSIEVTYSITNARELIIDYQASTDAPTPINLTNHSYFNLGGPECRSILDHELWINADKFIEVNQELIPTGKILELPPAMDFRTKKTIGQNIRKVTGGYDHNYVLNEASIRDPKVRVFHPSSGRMLEVFTTQPGLQFYSGNFLNGTLQGKNGIPLEKHQGLCLETQFFPDSPNHVNFPDTILKPGETFTAKTIYKFSS